jgi:hypothetical protein
MTVIVEELWRSVGMWSVVKLWGVWGSCGGEESGNMLVLFKLQCSWGYVGVG